MHYRLLHLQILFRYRWNLSELSTHLYNANRTFQPHKKKYATTYSYWWSCGE
jgi:hypothetical protein